jgi:prophage antirepressor-like protein
VKRSPNGTSDKATLMRWDEATYKAAAKQAKKEEKTFALWVRDAVKAALRRVGVTEEVDELAEQLRASQKEKAELQKRLDAISRHVG